MLDAAKHFDILGVALTPLRKTLEFKETVLTKLTEAEGGSAVRILLMHAENEIPGGLLYEFDHLWKVETESPHHQTIKALTLQVRTLSAD